MFNNILQVKYTYDHLNQLIREDNKERGITIVYTYDANGNRTRLEEYDFNTGTLSGNPKWIDEYATVLLPGKTS